MAIPTCGATWSARFDELYDDWYYGAKSTCDRPAHHRDDHSGPIVWWDGGGDEPPEDGVRLSWSRGDVEEEDE